MSELYTGEPHINDETFESYLDVTVDGLRMGGDDSGFGLSPESRLEQGGYGAGVRPFNIDLIPWSEFPERIKHLERTESRLSDLRMIGDAGSPIKSLNQGREGFCWAYSVTAAVMMARAVENQPHKRLSGHAIGCKIKNFRNKGGWNPEAAEFVYNNGVPSIEFWPERSMSRGNDTQATWDEAAEHKMTDGFLDLSLSKYDRNLTMQQLLTLLCMRVPCPVDLMWWGHSVLALDPMDMNPDLAEDNPLRYAWRGINSWGDNWGQQGFFTVSGRKAQPDGGSAVVTSALSA